LFEFAGFAVDKIAPFGRSRGAIGVFVAFLPLAIAACSNSKPTSHSDPVPTLAGVSQTNSINSIGVPEKKPSLGLLSEIVSSNEVQNTGSAGQNFAPLERTKQVGTVISNQTKFSSKAYGVAGSPRITTGKSVRKGGGRYQVGKPYTIRGVRYVPKEDRNYQATGLASWYGPNFHGRLTANGEIYDQFALSAAHPTMPLPSYAKVTNLENGASVTVRVNDRGPFSRGRIIDLSSRAAHMLGYTKKGVAKVRVEYVGKARLDGLDEQQLLATYHPGSLNRKTVLASATTGNNSLATTPETKPAVVSAIAQSRSTRRTLDAFDSGRFGFQSTALSQEPRPQSLVNGYLKGSVEPHAFSEIRNQFKLFDADAPAEGMAQLKRLKVGPIYSKDTLFKLSEKFSDFGPVSVSEEASTKVFYLEVTVVSEDIEKIKTLLK